jgi:SAM-dependent methyltransferase
MKLHRLLATFVCLAAFACHAPSPATHSAAPAEPAAPTAPAEPAAPIASPAPTNAPAPAANRDPHGNKDVAAYIATLESDTRVTEMRPDFVVEKLALAPDAVVADIGCGPGVFALRFARACPKGVVYAVDIEPRQLDRLREHLLATQIENVVPVLCSATTPHLPPGRCDVIFIGDTYHHLSDRVDYMRRLKSAFSPTGRLVLFEYKPGKLPVGPPPEHKLQPGELAKELTEAGYELVTDFASHPYHDFQVWRVAQ